MSPRASTSSAKQVAATQVPTVPPSATRTRRRTRKAGAFPDEARSRYIAEAAYFKAEKRGFAEGGELADWFAAEAEIDALLDSRGAG